MARGGALFASYRFRSLPCRVRAFQVASCPLRLKANQFSSVSIQCERFLSFPSRFLAVSQRRISHRFDSISLLCHAWRIVALLCLCASVRAWPCESDSNRRVASGRPSFPPLRRSPPIPSLPWLLAADLFRCRSAQLEALPCHSAASRCTWIHVPSLLRRLPGGRFQAMLCHITASLSWRLHSALCRSVAFHIMALPFHCPSRRICAAPYHIKAILFFSSPLLPVSYRVASPPFHLHAHHLASIRCPVNSPRRVCHHLRGFANRGRAMQFRCLSTHLSPRRSWPFRFAASACVSFPFRCSAFYTSPCLSASLRLASPPCVAVSPHVGQIPALLRPVN